MAGIAISPLAATAIIPARGNSKGLPGKNLAKIEGKSLLQRAIDAAKEARHVKRVIVSTDAQDIAEEAIRCGAEIPYLRAAHLSTDTAKTPDVILDLLDNVPLDGLFVLLQPTSPMRTAEDIDKCLEKLVTLSAKSCVSVTALDKAPEWIYTMELKGPATGMLEPLLDGDLPLRRQDARKAFVLNGAIYAMTASDFRELGTLLPKGAAGYEMPAFRSIDIDTIEDLEYARLVAKR